MSIPIHLRSSFSDSIQVVAHPQKGSSMTSPSSDEALMILSRSQSGFCVGYPIFSFPDVMFGISIHVSPIGSLVFLGI